MVAFEEVVSQALNAHRAGTLAELLRQRPRLARWFVRPVRALVDGTSGQQVAAGGVSQDAIALVLAWACARARPDSASPWTPVDVGHWLDRPSWRPALAVLCQYGFGTVPSFPDRYRRTVQESAAENLCGLWNVGPSTFYRYLEKGKRIATESIMRLADDGAFRLSLREAFAEDFARKGEWPDRKARSALHALLARRAMARHDPISTLWHQVEGVDIAGACATIRRSAAEIAVEPECDALLRRCSKVATHVNDQVDVALARATVDRARGFDESELSDYRQAIEIANTANDRQLLGRAYLELGKYYETRDADRALSCLQESIEMLRAGTLTSHASHPSNDIETRNHYATALQRLAWFHVLRNDRRASSLLDLIRELPREPALPDDLEGLIQLTWGEYWRRAGQPRTAAEHQLRALNLFERLGDIRQVLSTCNNLCIIYGEAKEFDRALAYGSRILEMASRTFVDGYILAATRNNMGAAYFWQGRFDEAIASYGVALEDARRDRQQVYAQRAMFNLAECYYKRFQQRGDPADEAQGDAYAALVLQAPAAEGDSFVHEATRTLKADILGPHDGAVHQRLVPEEYVAHYPEMAEIQQQRARLALPCSAEDHIRAHLAIANAYLAISTKERERALELMQAHDLQGGFEAEVDALRLTFSRELTRERRLAAQWNEATAGMLSDDRVTAVLRRVLEAGWVNKSTYAQLCGVGLATASKHLGVLAERGLLLQTGKGPSTRYVLPEG